ncbi:MAG: helix-turn-helix domain-containing protein [Rhodobacteraceae bacterium]|nr:helix-turn-helix domain-containing protein [Paracoccaceae bacterium]
MEFAVGDAVKRVDLKQFSPAREGIVGNSVESVISLLRYLSPGRQISLEEAALILNESESYLETLLEEEKIPHVRTGSTRRIKYRDLMEYKSLRDKDRVQGLAQLVAMGQEYDKS